MPAQVSPPMQPASAPKPPPGCDRRGAAPAPGRDHACSGRRGDRGARGEPLPTTATAEEVVQAFELIDEYAEQARAADEQQLARIAALEQDIVMMEGLVRHARAAQEVTATHVQ